MTDKHHDIFRMVDEYLNGLLTRQEMDYVEQKCIESKVWSTAMEEARIRQESMEAIPPCEASDELIQQTLANIDTYEQNTGRWKRRLFRTTGLAAGIGLALLVGMHIWLTTPNPSPWDLRVYGQAEMLADTEASIRVQMFNQDRQRPMANVPVEITLLNEATDQTVQLASFTTDENGSGSPRFRLPDWSDGDYTLRVVADTRGADEEILQKVRLKRSWKVMLSTDKPVYQPGQTIHMRIMSLRKPDLKPVAGKEVEFSITDPKGNIIFKHTDVTSRYGITSADCALATEINEGLYTIQASVGNSESSSTVEVKHYVLPKFTADVELDRAWYEPGQTIRGSVDARYYFGKPVAGGRVHITAWEADVEQRVFTEKHLTLDEHGYVEFDLTCPDTLVGREQNSGDAEFRLVFEIQDTAGQTIERNVSRIISAQPVKLTLIPESGKLAQGLENHIYAFATYPDGKPAEVRLVISGLDDEVMTSPSGVAQFELIPQESVVDLTIRAIDAEGRSVTEQFTLKSHRPGECFVLRTDKAVYAGGETIQITVFASGKQPVYVDLIQDDQTILTESINVSQSGIGEYAFDIPPDLSGTIELNAYRYGRQGLAVRQSRVLQITAADNLAISVETDKPEYRPGEEAKLTFRITDENGDPVPGALSLSAVDEAVFGVQGTRPGLENTFFNLEQEILKPIYALYPWSPDLDTSFGHEDRVLLNKALMAYASTHLDSSMMTRDEVFQIMLDQGDIVPRQLEFLKKYDINELLEQGSFSEDFVQLMKQTGSNRVQSSTWPDKERSAQVSSQEWKNLFGTIWLILAITGGSVLFVIVAVRTGLFWLLFFLASCALLISIMLPSLSRARSSSKSMMAKATLKGLDTTLKIMQNEGFTLNNPQSGEGGDSVRVRQWFPETLLWRPELITDDNGHAQLSLPLADSITSWHLSASAVSGEGQLGGMTSGIRVFQPFFVDLDLPVALTRGDEISVPAVVYNYKDTAQTIQLELAKAEGFIQLCESTQEVSLEAGEIGAVYFRLRADQVGTQSIEIIARSEGTDADAVRRDVDIVPDGRKIEKVFNGTLYPDGSIPIQLPDNAIDGSAKLLVKFYPSTFSQLLEGLDGIFKRPYGCFEQTSSTTYPNILALDYLMQTGKSAPEVEAKARQFIHLGYQRLLGFEVSGGGFDWFGRPPANVTLTGYGLLEFQDMAKVHDVDPALIERTRQWLLNHQKGDGSWSPANSGPWHQNPTQRDNARLSTTAYIAWAVFQNGAGQEDVFTTKRFLLSHKPRDIQDPYTLALVTNALIEMGENRSIIRPYIQRLQSLARYTQGSKQAYWTIQKNGRTAFYGRGRTGNIEATALATLALIKANEAHKLRNSALTWLTEQRDGNGTWGSTQATVLALKALIAGTGKPTGEQVRRKLDITFDGKGIRNLNLAPDQNDVLQLISLSDQVTTGTHTLVLADRTNTNTGYQVEFSYHVPGEKPKDVDPSLRIDLEYDRTDLEVRQTVNATARIMNTKTQSIPMAIVDLPVPAGFAPDTSALDAMKKEGLIGKYQVTPRSIIVYLRSLEPEKEIVIPYRLIATMPVDVHVRPAKVYEYYNPEQEAESKPTALRVAQTA